MANNPIQWFPGHMAKARRMMQENLPLVDLVLELADARIPHSSRNPEIATLLGQKPHIIVLSKSTLADPVLTQRWVDHYRRCGEVTVQVDSLSGQGIRELSVAVAELMRNKTERYARCGMDGRKLRAMIVGIPNVGKSSLINRLAGGKRAKVEDRPGVTQNKQWVPTAIGLDLLDMPGVLWPKFEDERVGENLAITGAIRDQILDTVEIAVTACRRLMAVAPDAIPTRYKLPREQAAEWEPYELFTAIGRRRGFLIAGGEIDEERTAGMLLDEVRGGKLGRLTLELPEDEHA